MKKMTWMFMIVFITAICFAAATYADDAAINKWIEEFQPSVFNKDEQLKELNWFAETAKPLKGIKISSCAEGMDVHKWESQVLAKAFKDITGIEVSHEIIGEGDIVNRIARQIQTRRKIFDIYVNDADSIGYHLRTNGLVNLTEYMAGEGKDYTNPDLDLDDFLNPEFGQDYDGNQFQLPDQQFANLYWFRYDWFTDPKFKAEFKEKYGYELGVPLTWAAYEDIAEFFTGKTIDGQKVYGHMDFAKKSVDLGWRFTDAWLSIAGASDLGLPNGIPVDDWGIRVENKIPVGASVERGGATNSPAAVYACEKFVEWVNKYAPPYALGMDTYEAQPALTRGNIAQCAFFYIAFLPNEGFHKPPLKVDGKYNWRVAPTPHGKYWKEGMKVGYQDAGSWSIPKDSVKGKQRAAAWLWAQFCVSKSVALSKFVAGNCPVRKSTVFSEHAAKMEAEGTMGGAISFYKSPMEKMWTDSGPNVPHYPVLSEQWWQNIAPAITGDITCQEAMDKVAYAMDDLMGKMKLEKYSPKLNPKKPQEYWLNQPGAPWPPIEGRGEAKTIDYDELIKQWRQ